MATGTDSFRDDDGATFEAVIECLSHSGVTAGGPGALPADHYGPYLPVTRAQMATFISRELDTAKRIQSGGGVRQLAAFDGTNHFVDVAPGDVHLETINRLSSAGITAGGPNGRPANQFGPNLPVTRAQMATFLDRAHHLLTGVNLGRATDYFTDDDGNLHEASINGIALAGIAVGDGRSAFRPQGRSQQESDGGVPHPSPRRTRGGRGHHPTAGVETDWRKCYVTARHTGSIGGQARRLRDEFR